MSSKQLILFKGVDVKKLDSSLSELYDAIYATKTFALCIETTYGKSPAFKLALSITEDLADLCSELSDLSLKYMAHTQAMWDKTSKYDPYYSALEPRSPSRLVEIASDYKSRSKVMLLRLRACLERGSITVPHQLEEINKKFDQIYNLLR